MEMRCSSLARPWPGLLLLLGLVAGCAGPIGVERVPPEEVHRQLTGSVLSGDSLSESSRNVFRRANLLDVFEADPELALRMAHELVAERYSGRMSALTGRAMVAVSEAAFLHASRSGDRRYFVMASIYAWAFLFGEDAPLDPIDPLVRLAVNLYNRGITLTLLSPGAREGIELRAGSFELPVGSLEVSLDPEELRWGDRVFTVFTPVADLKIRGLQNRYREAGLGAPLAAATRRIESDDDVVGPILGDVQVPVSMVLVIDDVMEGIRSGELRGQIEIRSPGDGGWVEIEGTRYATEVEPSASLALMLSEIKPWQGELKAFFQGDLRSAKDGLTSLSLHRRGGIPLILVHGTASSTATWANLVNDLMADPEIRSRYEFWLFTYNTGAPILYSASLLRQAIADVVHTLDPNGEDPALRQAVVVGHSQGGLLAKLMAVESGDRFWRQVSDEPIGALSMTPGTRDLIESSMFVEPSPYVGRVVFISTPHRGSYLLNFGPTSLLRRLVRAPSSVVQAAGDLVKQNPESAAIRRIDDVDGALGQMNPSSPFLENLLEMPVELPVRAHSIISVKEFFDKEEQSDGVVRYESAHLADVESEVLIQSGHSCLDHPQVTEEVRRILLMHLGTTRTPAPLR